MVKFQLKEERRPDTWLQDSARNCIATASLKEVALTIRLIFRRKPVPQDGKYCIEDQWPQHFH